MNLTVEFAVWQSELTCSSRWCSTSSKHCWGFNFVDCRLFNCCCKSAINSSCWCSWLFIYCHWLFKPSCNSCGIKRKFHPISGRFIQVASDESVWKILVNRERHCKRLYNSQRYVDRTKFWKDKNKSLERRGYLSHVWNTLGWTLWFFRVVFLFYRQNDGKNRVITTPYGQCWLL